MYTIKCIFLNILYYSIFIYAPLSLYIYIEVRIIIACFAMSVANGKPRTSSQEQTNNFCCWLRLAYIDNLDRMLVQRRILPWAVCPTSQCIAKPLAYRHLPPFSFGSQPYFHQTTQRRITYIQTTRQA